MQPPPLVNEMMAPGSLSPPASPIAPIFQPGRRRLLPWELEPIPDERRAADLQRVCDVFGVSTTDWPAAASGVEPPLPRSLVQQWYAIPTIRLQRVTAWAERLGFPIPDPGTYLLATILYRLEGWQWPRNERGYPKDSTLLPKKRCCSQRRCRGSDGRCC